VRGGSEVIDRGVDMPSWVHSEKHMMIAHAVDDGCMPDNCHGLDDIEACQRECKI